jgi:hypothetical protein
VFDWVKFSASEYFDASTILARKLPHLWESALILSHRNPKPNPLLRLDIQDLSNEEQESKSAENLPLFVRFLVFIGFKNKNSGTVEQVVGQTQDDTKNCGPKALSMAAFFLVFYTATLFLAGMSYEVQRLFVETVTPVVVGVLSLGIINFKKLTLWLQILTCLAVLLILFSMVRWIYRTLSELYKGQKTSLVFDGEHSGGTLDVELDPGVVVVFVISADIH